MENNFLPILLRLKNENAERINLLCWNVCIKIKNTPFIKEMFDNLEKNNVLFDVFAGQEIAKLLDNGADKEYDTYSFWQEYYQNNTFAGVYYTSLMDANNGSGLPIGGYIAQGQMISTNLKIVESGCEFFKGKYELSEDFTLDGIKKQPRNYQRVIIEKNGKQFQVVNLHGCWNEAKDGGKDSTTMVNKLIEDFGKSELPTIILGDFNLLPETDEIEKMNNHFINLNNVFNIKATRPIFFDGVDEVLAGKQTVDYVFVNDKFDLQKSIMAVDEDNRISDHYPIMFSFVLK